MEETVLGGKRNWGPGVETVKISQVDAAHGEELFDSR